MTSRALVRCLAAAGTLSLVAGPMAGAATAAPKPKPATPVISAKPATPTRERAATFSFASTTAGVTYQCSLDAAAYVACASPHTYAGPLGEAAHIFKVRARNSAGTLSTAAQATWTIDLTAPPVPSLSGVPTPSPTGATTASLTFSSAEVGATYVCSLDGAAATACASPLELTSVAEGPHTFTVAAVDAAGNVSGTAAGAWTVDTTAPPAPTVTTGPATVTNATTASFQVFSPESSAVLTCSLDGAAATACPSPVVYTALTEGPHTLDVTASDSVGNGASAPQYAWTVDLTAPSPPAVLTGPDPVTKSAVGSFTFNGFDAVQLRCAVDSTTEYADCASPYATPALADGAHTLRVKGVDAANNESGATPYSWTVDNTPPPAATIAGPPALANASSATFTITNTEQLATFACALDGATPATACQSGVTFSSLADGAHTLVVTSSDSVGNTADASYAWSIDTVLPTITPAAPATITSPVTATFSEPVTSVSTASLVVRVTGSTTAVSAALTCADAAAAEVSCATGPVKSVTLAPNAALVPGQRYTIVGNPSGASTIADLAGNGLAATSSAFRAQTTIQETSPAARYSWRLVPTAAAHGSTFRTEHLPGASASYTFTGTAITWYTVKGRTQGVADVYVDGVKKATVNNYASTTAYRIPRTFTGLTNAKHTLKIVVRGIKGSTSGTGTFVAIDAMKVGTTLTVSPLLTMGWRVAPASAASGGALATADLAGQETSLTFRGTAIGWWTSTGRNRGIAKVYVDNVLKATVDNYASATTYNVRRLISGLSDGVHTIRVVVTGTHRSGATGNVVTLDRWTVA